MCPIAPVATQTLSLALAGLKGNWDTTVLETHMPSSTHFLARLVAVRDLDGSCVIEVDGELDLVSGYDLRHAFAPALHSSTGAVTLDLSRVRAVDDQGLATLEWCWTHAVESSRVLEWTGCIHPCIRDLTSRLAALDLLAHTGARTHR